MSLLIWLVLLLGACLAWLVKTVRKTKAGHRTMEGQNTPPDQKPTPPGPQAWPIIGSLHLMANFKEIPFEAFTNLKKVYGSIFQIFLGANRCVVVSGEEMEKEVLMTKGDHFDGRPDFKRFALMFGGNRRNSLAFCDFDELQQVRRRLMRNFTFPSAGNNLWHKLDQACCSEFRHLVNVLGEITMKNGGESTIDLKPYLNKACANIFNDYFCFISRRDYDDPKLTDYCNNFDKIFWEVNNGRAVDFLPWLMPFMGKNQARVQSLTGDIRKFVVEELIKKRNQDREQGVACNLLDAFMDKVDEDSKGTASDSSLDMDLALYAMEDILGGHSGASNIGLRALIDVATRPKVQENLRKELVTTLGSDVEFSLAMKPYLPHLVSCFYETVRTTCSPVVPHVANRDTSIAGYQVPSGTVIFINNHSSNFNPDLWEDPKSFDSSRFVEDGKFSKPQHFHPFSMGRRTCMGYKVVEYVVATMMASVVSRFELTYQPSENFKQTSGMLALDPGNKFNFTLKQKEISGSNGCRIA